MKTRLVMLLIVVFIFPCVSLVSITEATMVYLQIQPSSIISAMGDGNNGVADIWHRNPLVYINNPAIVALHDGIALGFKRDNYLAGSGVNDMYYNSSIISAGYRGLGVTLPFVNASLNFGTTMEYGSQEQTDEQGNSLGTFESSETGGCYGLAVNYKVFLIKDTYTSDWLDKFNLAIGFSYNDLYSDLGPGVGATEADSKGQVRTHIFNAGMIISYRETLNRFLIFETSAGCKFFNIGNQYVSYLNDEQKDPIGQNNIFGLGLSASVPFSLFTSNEPDEMQITENLISFRVLASKNYSDVLYSISSIGSEIGLLDAVFFRIGFYDKNKWSKGITIGSGLNLHFSDLIALEANFSRIETGGLVDYENSWDFMMMANLFKIPLLFQ